MDVAVPIREILLGVIGADERSIIECLLTEYAVNKGFRALKVGPFLYCTRKRWGFRDVLIQKPQKDSQKINYSRFLGFVADAIKSSLQTKKLGAGTNARQLSKENQAVLLCLQEPIKAYEQILAISPMNKMEAGFMFNKLLSSYTNHHAKELQSSLNLRNVLLLAIDEAMSNISRVCQKLGLKTSISGAQSESDMIDKLLEIKANYLVKFWNKVHIIRQLHTSIMIAVQETERAQAALLEKMSDSSDDEPKAKLKTKYEVLNLLTRLKQKLLSLEQNVGWKYKQSIINDSFTKLVAQTDSQSKPPKRDQKLPATQHQNMSPLPKQASKLRSARYQELMVKISLVNQQIDLKQRSLSKLPN